MNKRLGNPANLTWTGWTPGSGELELRICQSVSERKQNAKRVQILAGYFFKKVLSLLKYLLFLDREVKRHSIYRDNLLSVEIQ